MPQKNHFATFFEVRRIETQAYSFIQRKEYEKAIKLLKRVLSLNAEYCNAHYFIAWCYERIQMKDEGLHRKHLAEAHRLSPLNQIFSAENPFEQMKNLDESINELQAEILEDLDRGDKWRHLIKKYSSLMDYKTASWICYIVLNTPQLQQALNARYLASQIAMVLFHIGDYTRNYQLITTAQSIFGNDALRCANSSVLGFLTGNDQRSEHHMRNGLVLDPNFPRGYYICSFYLHRTMRIEAAFQSILKSIQYHDLAMVYRIKLAILQCLFRSEQKQEILENLKKCIHIIATKTCEDQIVMEPYWYPFLGFCCQFLKSQTEKNKVSHPITQYTLKLMDQFIIRGNLQRVQYSQQILRLVGTYTPDKISGYWLAQQYYTPSFYRP